MSSCGELKQRAKNALKNGFGNAYGMILTKGFISNFIQQIISIFFYLVFMGATVTSIISLVNRIYVIDEVEMFNFIEILLRFSIVVLIIALLQLVMVSIVRIVFLNHLDSGVALFFLRNRETNGQIPFSTMFHNLKRKNYGGIFRGMSWRDLWQFIWILPVLLVQLLMIVIFYRFAFGLLAFTRENLYSMQFEQLFWDHFINSILPYIWLLGLIFIIYTIFSIVSVIKRYSYRPAEWLLADNPNLHYRSALQLSKKMVKGKKGNWFLLDLSFIGWYFLALLIFPLSFFTLPLVKAYHSAADAEFYAELREEALSNGLLKMDDLGFVKKEVVQEQFYSSATEFYSNHQ